MSIGSYPQNRLSSNRLTAHKMSTPILTATIQMEMLMLVSEGLVVA